MISWDFCVNFNIEHIWPAILKGMNNPLSDVSQLVTNGLNNIFFVSIETKLEVFRPIHLLHFCTCYIYNQWHQRARETKVAISKGLGPHTYGVASSVTKVDSSPRFNDTTLSDVSDLFLLSQRNTNEAEVSASVSVSEVHVQENMESHACNLLVAPSDAVIIAAKKMSWGAIGEVANRTHILWDYELHMLNNVGSRKQVCDLVQQLLEKGKYSDWTALEFFQLYVFSHGFTHLAEDDKVKSALSHFNMRYMHFILEEKMEIDFANFKKAMYGSLCSLFAIIVGGYVASTRDNKEVLSSVSKVLSAIFDSKLFLSRAKGSDVSMKEHLTKRQWDSVSEFISSSLLTFSSIQNKTHMPNIHII